MRTRILRSYFVATACLSLLAGAPPVAEGAFPDDIPADFPGRWQEVQGDGGPWHGGKALVVGAPGFDVTLSDWPRLLQRGFYDIIDAANGTREVYNIAGWLDLGLIRTKPGSPGKPKLIERSWTHRRYRFAALRLRSGQADGRDMDLLVSRLSPAVVAMTDSPELELFAGPKRSYRAFVEDELPKARVPDIGRGPLARWQSQNKPVTRQIPPHVAFVRDGRVVVADTRKPVDLSGLDEPWLLFWYGQAAQFYRTKVPNVLWRTQALTAAMAKDYFVLADLPVLVVLQKRPTGLRPSADALRLSFADKAGAVAITPLLGFYHPPAKQTAMWTGGIPKPIAARCRTWTKRLKHFPVRCHETQTVSADGGSVTFRQRFTYVDLPDDWNTPGEKIAPIPPAVAMAERYGFAVTIEGKRSRRTQAPARASPAPMRPCSPSPG